MKNTHHFKSAFLPFAVLVLTAGLAQGVTVTDETFSSGTNYTESVTFDLNNTQAYTGVISGTDNTMTKTGSGVLSLSANQTYTGATTISGGTLSINVVSRLDVTSGITLTNGATLKYNSTTAATLAPRITVDGAGTINYDQPTTNVLTLKISGDANSVVTLHGKNNPNSTSNVSTFKFLDPQFTGTVEITGGKILLDASLSTTQVANYRLNGGTLMSGVKPLTIAQPIELGAIGGSIRVGYDCPINVSGKITGSGQLGIAGDNGWVHLSNSGNDFSGGIQIGGAVNGNPNGARLVLDADNALGTGVITWGSDNVANYLDMNGHSTPGVHSVGFHQRMGTWW